jgi:histidyl-tRNA synthetase
VDIFGVNNTSAEIEVINMAYDITRTYGLKDTDFEIRLNNRKVMNYVTRDVFDLNEETAQKISKLIDKKAKIKAEAFEMGVKELFAEEGEKAQKFLTLLNSKNFQEFTSQLPQSKEEHQGLREISDVIRGLERLGITNVRFDQTLMRGFDYYTGTVFEIFDLNPVNRRSVFGGGRYDDLLSLFGNEKVPAFGFGAGDVIARDLMETYGTLPQNQPSADLALCIVGDQNTPYAFDLAQKLRSDGIRVSVDISGKKLGDQISNANKRGIPYIICIGDEEVKNGKLRIKNLKDENEVVVSEGEVVGVVLKN